MSLQGNGIRIFISGGTGSADDEIAHLVTSIGKLIVFGKVFQIITDCGCVERTVRDTTDFPEIFENICGLKSIQKIFLSYVRSIRRI